MIRTSHRLTTAAFAISATLLAACVPEPGSTPKPDCGAKDGRTELVALTTDGKLACLDVANPTASRDLGTITGLDGETLVGIDYRSAFTDAMGVSNGVPAEGALYGLGSNGGIYWIDATTAVATKKSQLNVALTGTAFGVDFNPTVDRLRIVSDTGQNLRVNVDTGVAVVDGALNAAGAPVTGVAAAGYTNVDTDPATATTLYVINTTTDSLHIQIPPNDGTIANIGGPLGTDISGPVGFDLVSTVEESGGVWTTTDVTGYVTATTATGGQLFEVTPFSGRLRSIGNLDIDVQAIAAPLGQ